MSTGFDQLWSRLFDEAAKARSNAYAPYSSFAVGCALIDESNTIHSGCNVENAAYPQGWCAEASAIASMVTAGNRRIGRILVIADRIGDGRFCTPCGGCRQKILEFSGPDVEVMSCDPAGAHLKMMLGELIPAGFEFKKTS